MGILKNPRHELFAQELAKGKSATEAYTLAGYKACRQNAARLTTNDDIRARLAELQATAAKASEVTIQSLLNELEDARVKASNLDQLSAAVRAIEAKAKVSGLLVQRVEVGGPSDFDDCESTEAIADKMLVGPGGPIEGFRPVDERDRQGLIELIDRHGQEMQEFLASIRARPIAAERCDPARLPTDWRELELHSSARVNSPAEARDKLINHRHRRLTHGNGGQR